MEYVTQIHTGTDGVVQITVPKEWADKDVTLQGCFILLKAFLCIVSGDLMQRLGLRESV